MANPVIRKFLVGAEISKKRIAVALFFITIFILFSLTPFSIADNGILVPHGDHIELTCENNGLVNVVHTIIVTANVTERVTSISTYSFMGDIVGEPRYEHDPEINPIRYCIKLRGSIDHYR